MEIFRIEDFSFTYPGEEKPALSHISLSVGAGTFTVLCGSSGCGKTTLLRSMKSQIAPKGERRGEIDSLPAADIGFVFQNPDNQIVTDTVRHELAFGMENLGLPSPQIRQRAAETALFLGIDGWMDRSVYQLSGGEKQLLNLASVLAMRPRLLLLDEPSSQLDPVARKNFLELLVRVNRELGIAVLISEHHLEELLPLADGVIFMEEGRITFRGNPQEFVKELYRRGNPFTDTLPAAVRIAERALSMSGQDSAGQLKYPLTVREGREFLRNLSKSPKLCEEVERKLRTSEKSGAEEADTRQAEAEQADAEQRLLCTDHIWFRYEKQLPFVLKGLSLEIKKQSFHVILGGNGSGKTTLLSILSRRNYANRGKIRTAKEYKGKRELKVSLLSQNPKAMFSLDTVREELEIASGDEGLRKAITEHLGLTPFLDRHPYDLSGGEQQRTALAMAFLTKPDLLLLDEPTKGLDPFLKVRLASCLKDYIQKGGTVLCVTHDVEFAVRYADVCSLLSEGEILCTEEKRKFFRENVFYTTDVARIAAGILPGGLLCEDFIF